MPLDDLLPRYDLADAHPITLAAPPNRALAAMMVVTPAEMPLARFLFALRWLPPLLRRRGVFTAGTIALHEQMPTSGFLLPAENPGREVVIGFVGRPREAAELDGADPGRGEGRRLTRRGSSSAR